MPLNFSALLLPDTIAREDVIRQLLLYFETIALYSPTEDIPDLLPHELRTLCCHYAPAPFGDELENFQRLIRDMTANRAQYYGGGLSSLSATAKAVDEESVWRLVNRLSPQASRAPQPEALLQARLLLKLAEIHDQEEEEIERTLREINGQGHSMLSGLTDGDEEEGLELLDLPRHGGQKSDGDLARRLKAWAHLFLADDRRPSHWQLCTNEDVWDLLADYATSQMDAAPARLFRLPLPGPSIMALDPPAYLRERTAWRQTAAKCLAALHSSLEGIASGRPASCAPIQEQLSAYSTNMPAKEGKDRGTLDFYRLPLSLPGLFAKITNTPDQPTEAAYPSAIVAVISP